MLRVDLRNYLAALCSGYHEIRRDQCRLRRRKTSAFILTHSGAKQRAGNSKLQVAFPSGHKMHFMSMPEARGVLNFSPVVKCARSCLLYTSCDKGGRIISVKYGKMEHLGIRFLETLSNLLFYDGFVR